MRIIYLTEKCCFIYILDIDLIPLTEQRNRERERKKAENVFRKKKIDMLLLMIARSSCRLIDCYQL
jgi:hypothetical protein